MQTLDGCNQLTFGPLFQVTPSTSSAASASGLDVNLNFHDEGLTTAEGTAQSQLKDTTVVLPEGFTVNPSSGVGLAGCREAQYAEERTQGFTPSERAEGHGCPTASELGTVEASTPLLTQPLHGSIFIAEPYENPFKEPENGHPGGTLVALYIVIKNPETGIMVKLPGKVLPNLSTGQLTTVVDNTPQFPISHFNFHFREGTRAPLITPPTCGTFTTTSDFTPWSTPFLADAFPSSAFQHHKRCRRRRLPRRCTAVQSTDIRRGP